jgi:hypothetical protein
MYIRCLKQILEPLGIYDLENGAGAVELEVIGKQMNEIFAGMEILAAEAIPLNASGFGLERYEAALPYRPSYITVADRRRAIMALLRIRNGCFTQELLQDTISGCGIEATIEESNIAQTAKISFPQYRGIPGNFEALKKRIEQIVPCHLSVEYRFIYSTWQELMSILSDWSYAGAGRHSWHDIEILEG